MSCPKGLFFHPFTSDDSIFCFSAFHNINCPNGFVYFNSKVDLPFFFYPFFWYSFQSFLQEGFRIAQLSPYMSYNFPWIARKVEFGCSVHQISYHVESTTYTLVWFTFLIREWQKATKLPLIFSRPRPILFPLLNHKSPGTKMNLNSNRQKTPNVDFYWLRPNQKKKKKKKKKTK